MIPFAALLPETRPANQTEGASPKHRGLTITRHAEAFIEAPSVWYRPRPLYSLHVRHRPIGLWSSCPGRHCNGATPKEDK